MPVVDAGRGDVREELAGVEAGSGGFQGVVTKFFVDLLGVGIDFVGTDDFLALVR
jgi:hypothetical protein